MSGKIKGEVTVQNFTDPQAKNEVEIGTELKDEKQLDAEPPGDGRRAGRHLRPAGQRQAGSQQRQPAGALASGCAIRWRAHGVPMTEQQLQKLVADILNFRDTPPRSGLITDFNPIVLRARHECWYYEHSSNRSVIWRHTTCRRRKWWARRSARSCATKLCYATLYALAGCWSTSRSGSSGSTGWAR